MLAKLKPSDGTEAYRVTGYIALLVVGFGVVVIVITSSRSTPTVRFSVAVNRVEPGEPYLPASAGWPYSQRAFDSWGLSEQAGVRIESVTRVNGKRNVTSLIEGGVDVAYAGATPIVNATLNGEDILILAQTARAFGQVVHVARADHVDDWMDQPIGVIEGTILESAIIDGLRYAGRPTAFRDKEVTLLRFQNVTEIFDALVDGTVSSAALFKPQGAILVGGSDRSGTALFVDITPPHSYLFGGYYVTTRERWNANRDGIMGMMAAVRESYRLIAEDPDTYLKKIHEYESGDTYLRDAEEYFWEPEELVFVTDKELIEADLRAEAQLMVLGGLINSVPDFSTILAISDEVGLQR